MARGFDLAAMHGINRVPGTASTVVGTNHFDGKVTGNTVTYAAATPDANLESAIAQIGDNDVTGMALSKTFGSAMANVKANGVKGVSGIFFRRIANKPNGIGVSVNSTVSGGTTKDHAIIGDFQNGFKWGYSKEIPIEIIKYGDPDNSGKDLKGYNQIYIRAEIYLGWGILLPEAFSLSRKVHRADLRSLNRRNHEI